MTGTVATVIGTGATVVKTAGLTPLAVELPETGTVLEDDAGNAVLVAPLVAPVRAVLTLLAFDKLAGAGAVETAATVVLAGTADGGGIVIVPLALGTVLARSEISCELLDTGIEVTVGIAPDRLVETAPRVPLVELRRFPTVAPETETEAGKPVTSGLTVPVAELSTLLTAIAAAAGAISGSPVLLKPAPGGLMAVPKMPPALRTCAN